eukprot:12396299-Heterocapsa_arctica.AAC.1
MERSACAATSRAPRRGWPAPAGASAQPGSCGIRRATRSSRPASGPNGRSGYPPPGDSPMEEQRADT